MGLKGLSFRFRQKSRRGQSGSVVDVPQGSVVGDIDGPTAVVGPEGTIGALDGSWQLSWGAGADDRWHIASNEVAVRQVRVDDGPVFETSMRVPGGDLICRVGGANNGVSRSLAIEFTNASPGAVALACVLNVDGPHRVSVDRSELRLDGRIMLKPERQAGAVISGSDDPWTQLADNPEQVSATTDLDELGGYGAMVFPLPHKASLLLQIPIDGDPIERLPLPADIAAGWRAVTRGAAFIEVPDRHLGEAWLRLLPDLVLAAGFDDPLVAAEVAPFLDIAGLHDEADRARVSVVVAAEARSFSGGGAAAAIEALASRDLRAGQDSGLDQLIAGLLDDAGDATGPTTLTMAALALRGSDRRLAADLAKRAAEELTSNSTAGPLVSSAARGAARVTGRIVGPPVDGAIDLLPSVPADWFGQPLDVRGVVSHAGTISFSVRWHGDRPALLWDREGGPDQVRITCSGLDPDWGSSERSAEALLAAPRDSGTDPRTGE